MRKAILQLFLQGVTFIDFQGTCIICFRELRIQFHKYLRAFDAARRQPKQSVATRPNGLGDPDSGSPNIPEYRDSEGGAPASGGLPVARIRTMEEVLSRSTATESFNMLMLTIFGCLALLLAAIGIYGLMAYSVSQRTQEIGIRLALGAESSQIRNMVVFQGVRLALAGVALGSLRLSG